MVSSLSESRFEEIVKKFQEQKDLLIIGDVGIDKYTLGEVTRISPEAPVPVVEVKKEWPKLGLASNIAHNLKALGVGSTVCCAVGDDTNATKFESLLEEIGLKTWGVVRDNTRPTTFKERVVTNVQQVCRIDYESSKSVSKNVEEKLWNRFNEFIDGHSAVIVEDYNKGVLTSTLLKQIIETCRKKNKLLTLDPARGRQANLYKGANLLKPNLTEAKMLVSSLGYHDQSTEEICKILLNELELDMLALTLGADGMALVEKKNPNQIRFIPTLATEVFDVSGAGDTVISLLTVSLLTGASLDESAWIGNCGASVVVSKKGTAIVELDELRRAHQRLLKSIKT